MVNNMKEKATGGIVTGITFHLKDHEGIFSPIDKGIVLDDQGEKTGFDVKIVFNSQEDFVIQTVLDAAARNTKGFRAALKSSIGAI